MNEGRRDFLRAGVLLAVPLLARGAMAQTPSPQVPVMQGKPELQGGRIADTTKPAPDRLDAPELAGRATKPLGPLDNDPTVIGIERRLRCTCGCTLDVFTCRTTDFSCTYSPAMHEEVVKGVQDGATPEQIVAAFVAREGQSVLMSPPPHGFNLAGYLVPGLAMASVGLALAAWLSRRRTEVAAAAVAGQGTAAPSPDAEQLERLRKALDEVDS